MVIRLAAVPNYPLLYDFGRKRDITVSMRQLNISIKPLLRKFSLIISACLLSALILVQINGTYSQDEFNKFSESVQEYTLANNLSIIYYPRNELQTIACVTSVNTGSKNDPQGQSGIANLSAKLIYEGSGRIGTTNYEKEKKTLGQIDRLESEIRKLEASDLFDDRLALGNLLQRLQVFKQEAKDFTIKDELTSGLTAMGAKSHGYEVTSDFINFWSLLPANMLDAWFQIESDRLTKSIFRNFYNSRDDLIKYIKNMPPDKKLLSDMVSAVYSTHESAKPIFGNSDELDSLTRPDLLKFAEEYITPSKTTLVFVGRIDANELKALAKKFFGGWANLASNRESKEPETRIKGNISLKIKSETESIIIYGFPRYGLYDAKSPAYDILAEFFNEDTEDGLKAYLTKHTKFASGFEVQAHSEQFISKTLFAFKVKPAGPANVNEIEHLFAQYIEGFRKEGIPDSKLEEFKLKLFLKMAKEITDPLIFAKQLAVYKNMTGDWHNLFYSAVRLKQLTSKHIDEIIYESFSWSNKISGKITRD